MSLELHEKRFAAALASCGISSQPIYQMTMGLLRDHGIHGDLLEFGAGTGNLLKQLLACGTYTSLTGADILPRPDDLAADVNWIPADLNHKVPVSDETYDVIVSTEVIEHLENPRAVFREFHRLLRPNGILIVTTPNQESLRSLAGLLFGKHFVAFHDTCYPAHITALLHADFERICLESSFEAPRFFYTNSGGIPKLPSIHWQKVSFGMLKGKWFSDNVAVVTKKISTATGAK